jgi:replicative DNA helicase
MTAVDEAPATGLPPQDIPAEIVVLGAMMLSPAVADEISELLDPEDFYRNHHGAIYAAILAVAAASERPDIITVGHELDRRGDLLRVGGAPFLHTCTERVPSVAMAGSYARQVADAAGRRRLVEAAAEIGMMATSGEELADIRDRAADVAYRATTDQRDRSIMESVGDLVIPELAHVEDIAAGRIPPGIPTGLSDFDRITGGMQIGQLIIPAGRTSMGKSVVTQNWVLNGVRVTQRPAILFSVEMSKREMMQRLLAEIAEVSLASIRQGAITDRDREKLQHAQEVLLTLPLFLVDDVRTTPAIRAYCRRFRQRMGDLALIGVDYLQRLQPTTGKRRPDRHVEVGEWGDDLKTLGQDMSMPVVAPCQLNRGPENRTGKEANKPKLSDLRESGNLEQTADVVALIYRPDYYDKQSTRRGEADFDIAKNRNGPTDTITVAARLHHQRFLDMPTFGSPTPSPWQ